jgi:hypothetical protein
MSLEGWYYVAEIVAAVVAIMAFVALVIYAIDTRKLRNTAEEQLEGMARPCVLLMSNPDQSQGFDKSPLVLKNLGSGVALNIRYQLLKNAGGPWIEAAALPVGGSVVSHILLSHILQNPLICEFESLSGAKYRTESFISELTTNLDPRHKFTKL